MFRKLFLALLALSALAISALAIAFPQMNQRTLLEVNGARAVQYHKREWKLLPFAYWGFNLDPPERSGCCDESGGQKEHFYRFGFISITDSQSINKLNNVPVNTGQDKAASPENL
ncbi:MAG: hypothetical protein QM758_01430 [Armatimonas sp.]